MNRIFQRAVNNIDQQQSQSQQQFHLGNSIALLDSKIENARKDLECVRSQRQANQTFHEQHCATHVCLIGRIQHQISQVRKQNNIGMYCKVMEDFAHAPIIQRKQGMLLKIIHSNEVHAKYISLAEIQNQKLTEYMMCEVSVLEDEQTMLEIELLNRKNSIVEEMQQMYTEFSYYDDLQRKVTNKLRSMITPGLDEQGSFYANTPPVPRSSPHGNPIEDEYLDKRALFDLKSESFLDWQHGPDWSSGDLKKGLTVFSGSLRKLLDRAKPSNNVIGVGEPLLVATRSFAA
jgi:hypothetical protein